jgi:hypothetical protein
MTDATTSLAHTAEAATARIAAGDRRSESRTVGRASCAIQSRTQRVVPGADPWQDQPGSSRRAAMRPGGCRAEAGGSRLVALLASSACRARGGCIDDVAAAMAAAHGAGGAPDSVIQAAPLQELMSCM